MAKYQSSAHCVGESNWHIQLTPAYRREIFRDSLTRELTMAYLIEAAQNLSLKVTAIEFGPDHIHLFLENTRKISVVEAVQKLKGYSSYKMRKGHKFLFKNELWGKKFWSGGYFYQTVGVITTSTVKDYINNSQKKHWEERPKSDIQRTLVNYGG
jgi:REP element-mobilizing transposase RayT